MLCDMHWTGKVDSVAFTIGGKDIAWYGIIITCAMLAGLVAALIRGKKHNLTIDVGRRSYDNDGRSLRRARRSYMV